MNHGDFQDDLTKDGFAVIKGVIPPERVTQYREKAKDWLLSFGTELDFEDNKTWIEKKKNLPVQNKIRTFAGHCVSHENVGCSNGTCRLRNFRYSVGDR